MAIVGCFFRNSAIPGAWIPPTLWGCGELEAALRWWKVPRYLLRRRRRQRFR